MSEKAHHGYAVEAIHDPAWPYGGQRVGIWSAHPIVMPGCIATGHTLGEALADLDTILAAIIEHHRDRQGPYAAPDLPDCVGELVFIHEWTPGISIEWTSITDPEAQEVDDG